MNKELTNIFNQNLGVENFNSLKKYDGVFLKITDEKTNLVDITSKIKKTNPKN